MSEFKFDKLKNYEAPNSWAEKAIATANEKKKEKIYFSRGFRVAMICVCFILICVMGFTVCMQVLDDGIIVPVNVEETVGSTKNPHFDKVNVNVDERTEAEDSEFETSSAITENEETKVKETTEKPTEKVEPTKKKGEKETQKTDEKPTKKPQSEKPTVKPQQKPDSTTPYIEPTETPIENRVVCSTIVEKNLISNDTVYCRIYDCDNDVYLGDDDIFSSLHLAEIYGSSNDNYYIRYFPVKSGVITKNGEYIVMFYDENGRNFKTFGFTVKEF